MTAEAVAALLARLGIGIVAAAVELARALSGKVDAAAVKLRATQYLTDAQTELAASEARERDIFTRG